MRIATIFAAFAAVSLSAQAFAAPVTSLNDLPRSWDGVAGDFVTRVPAKLTIGRITKITRNDTSSFYKIDVTYDVDGSTLSLGERAVTVKNVTLRDFGGNFENVYEVNFALDDELTPYLMTTVRYDEATDTFTLREPMSNGTSRLVLHGKR